MDLGSMALHLMAAFRKVVIRLFQLLGSFRIVLQIWAVSGWSCCSCDGLRAMHGGHVALALP